jgi:hypothetical protein
MSDVMTLKDIEDHIRSDVWIYRSINCKISDTIYKICCNIGLLREKFRKSPNYSFEHIKIVGPSDNFVPRQVSCYNSDFTCDSEGSVLPNFVL